MENYINTRMVVNRMKLVLSITTDKQLADQLSVATSTISSWIHRNTLDYDHVLNYFATKCNLHWLLVGSSFKESDDSYAARAHKVAIAAAGLTNSAAHGEQSTPNADARILEHYRQLVLMHERINESLLKQLEQCDQERSSSPALSTQATTSKHKTAKGAA